MLTRIKPGRVIQREKDFKRLALADQQVQGGVADFLVGLDFALDAGYGISVLQVLPVDGHSGDAGLAELGDDLGGQLLPAVSQDFPGFWMRISSAAVRPARPLIGSQ